MSLERQMSLRKKANSAMERLDLMEASLGDLRNTYAGLAKGLNQVLSRLDNDMRLLREMLDTIIQIVGPEEVAKVLAENRLARMQAEADETRANIAKAMQEGNLVQASKVSARSLVVGRDLKPDGTEIPPGYLALPMPRIDQEYHPKLLDQGVGYIIDTKDGGKFEVLEIYDPVDQKATEEPTLVPGPVDAGAPEAVQS